MRFTRLRIAGFKSFVDPVDLPIEPGLTGVVGPNGCGKSNLTEALRWAMGESNARRMRGGEMDDVIFNGSDSRPARNNAEVHLYLDNADRAAPAAFNDEDRIEIVRRIERGAGTNYRVNGRDARARDVQLMFADLATGAQSAGIVSQGKIGAAIGAKPVERRILLEEAAGISGLRPRRNEAENKLRGAEQNLTRLEDVLHERSAQLESLRKQAKHAARYRRIAEQMRETEAVLLHLRWRDAASRVETAKTALDAQSAKAADLTALAARATTAHAEASEKLPALRQREAEAAAALQRLMLERESLGREKERIRVESGDMRRRLGQIGQDVERERALAADSSAALARLEQERTEIVAAQADEIAETARSDAKLNEAKERVRREENSLSSLTERIAENEARHRALKRQTEDLGRRIDRLANRSSELTRQRQAAEAENVDLRTAETAEKRVMQADKALEASRIAAEAAERRKADAEAMLHDVTATLREARDRHGGVAAEVRALEDFLSSGVESEGEPILDAVEVEEGCEAALGAAFGDDLTAPEADAGPVRWETRAPYDSPPALPDDAACLANHVRAPAALRRRLVQTGIVATEADGARLAPALLPGQRLVTAGGALWRWDGFVLAAGAPTAAAIRLRQKNKLVALLEDLADTETGAAEAEQAHDEALEAALEARDADKQGRQTVQTAVNESNQARRELTRIAEQAARLRSRLQGLDDSAAQIADDRNDANAQLKETEDSLHALPDLSDARAEADRVRAALAQARATLTEAQSGRDALRRESEGRKARLSATADERLAWRRRVEASDKQLSEFARRRDDAKASLERLDARPAEIEAQQATLAGKIEAAEQARRAAADELAKAESHQAELGREMKRTESALADARETRARLEGGVTQADSALAAVVERIQERLSCRPETALAAARDGKLLQADAKLPDPDQLDSKLERLRRERENMGAVNLRAEIEVQEHEEQIALLKAEREDLVQAIDKLRRAISRLNREARERLMTAFRQVDGHFVELFARLFGGGKAHLSLTDADDPLNAGLEIMASPPGKRLQSLSLLSGGEQALTAIALIFAVFMTNPAPICVLDEVDAPLDDNNVDRFCALVEEIARTTRTRFLVITHHRMTMARVDRLFGVTMTEEGVSRLVSVDLQGAEDLRESA